MSSTLYEGLATPAPGSAPVPAWRPPGGWAPSHYSPLEWLCWAGEQYGDACNASARGDAAGYRAALLRLADVVSAALQGQEATG